MRSPHGCVYAALWVLVMLGAATGLLIPAAPAYAHATVVSSTPTDGARLDTSPSTLTFDLNEPVSLVDGSAQLLDADGGRHPFAAASVENGRQRLVLRLAQPLADGSYLATARVVSADTHVVSLSLRFGVGAAATGSWDDGTEQPAVGRGVVYVVKFVVYTGYALSAGVLLAASWAWRNSIGGQRFLLVYRAGAGLLAIGLLGRLGVLVAEQANGVRDATADTVWAVLATPFGTALGVAIALSVVVLALPPRRTHASLALGGAHAVAAVVAVALGGHGGSTELWPLPLLLTVVHVYAVAVWLGGLVVLAVVGTSAVPVRRWHRVALAHVPLVLVAGALLAILQVRRWHALVATSYGLTLLVKVALVGAALAAGYVVWRRLDTPGAREPRVPTKRIVAAEIAVTLLIVAATAVLSSLVPAKDAYTTNVTARMDFGGGDVVDVEIDTIRRGTQIVTVSYAAAGRALPGSEGADIAVELSSAEANVARLPVELSRRDDPSAWMSTDLIVPSPGRWKVTVRFDGGHGPKLASFFYEVL